MDNTKTSKKLSFILRHKPEQFGLMPDEYGFIEIEPILSVLNINKETLFSIVDSDSKKRYEVVGNKIRALSGHSYEMDLIVESIIPNAPLYHGTAKKNLSFIKEQGLLPMNRKFVHLSEYIDTATTVAKRHSNDIIIFEVDIDKALLSGVKFFQANDKTFLSSEVPFDCLKIKN